MKSNSRAIDCYRQSAKRVVTLAGGVSLLVMIASANAFADNKVGNGGHAIVCSTGSEKVRLLDLYEAKKSTKFIAIETYEKSVEFAIDRLKQASEKLGSTYANRWKEFLQDVEWVEDRKLTLIKDSLHTEQPLSPKCKLEQLAVRRDVIVAEEKRFQIRKDLWDQLSTNGKAALVMHELLYQHFSRLGEKDSRAVRRVNRLLFDKDYQPTQFWKLISELRVPIYP